MMAVAAVVIDAPGAVSMSGLDFLRKDGEGEKSGADSEQCGECFYFHCFNWVHAIRREIICFIHLEIEIVGKP